MRHAPSSCGLMTFFMNIVPRDQMMTIIICLFFSERDG